MVVEYAPLDEAEDTITPTPIIPRSRASPPPRRSIKIENKLLSFLKHDKTECNYLIMLFLMGVFCLLLSN